MKMHEWTIVSANDGVRECGVCESAAFAWDANIFDEGSHGNEYEDERR